MKDFLAQALGIDSLSKQEMMNLQQFCNVQIQESLEKPFLSGPMHKDVKKAISNTLKGHSVSKETKIKISKTVSMRNKEGVCGFKLGHSCSAGSIGGRSKSANKLNSVRKNQNKSLETIRGSIWMYNSDNRARVPKEKVEQKIKEGWKVGFKK